MPMDIERFNFTNPADYRVTVLGELGTDWSEKFCGMTILHDTRDNNTITILEGHLRDQAALSGILNMLYDLHFAVISVEMIKDKENPAGQKLQND